MLHSLSGAALNVVKEKGRGVSFFHERVPGLVVATVEFGKKRLGYPARNGGM